MSFKIVAPVLIIVSELDQAGMNMLLTLREILQTGEPQEISVPESWKEGSYTLEFTEDMQIAILTISVSHIRVDFMKGFLDTNLVIFASKHSSESGKKTLLAHPLGNWGEDTIGSGLYHSIGIAPAYALYTAYHSIKKNKIKASLDEFWVGLEVSHHGPTELDVPAIFMETGGSATEWADLRATEVVAKAITDVAHAYTSPIEETLPCFIGIGGGHYAPAFIKRVDAKMLMVAHMIPKYHSDKLDEDFLRKVYERSIGKDMSFLLDKKGLKGSERSRLIELITKLGYSYKLTTDYSTK